MSDWKLLTTEESKELTPIEDFVDPPENPWKCYTCGQEKVFSNDYDAWTGEYTVYCNECGSDWTFPNREGEPIHECGEWGWDCWKCNVFLCEECWEWKPKRVEHEEEDYICDECYGKGE